MLLEFIQNATLLIALTMLYGILVRIRNKHVILNKIFMGLLFGIIAVAGMNMPFTYEPGIIYDGRSIVLTLAGLFGGYITAGVAVIIALLYRLYLGGFGVWAGIATILICAFVGLAFRRYFRNKPEKINFISLVIIGIVTHLAMLAAQLLMPWPEALALIKTIWLPVMTVFPLAFTIMALILKNEEERVMNTEKIRIAESLYRTTLYSIGDAVITTNYQGNVRQMNRIAEELTGWHEQEARDKPLQEVFHIVNTTTGATGPNPIKKVIETGKIIGLANHTVLISRAGREYQIADSAAPIKNENNEVIGVVLVFQDVTESYRIQAKIRINEEKLAEAQQIAKLGHYTLDIRTSTWSNSIELDNIFGIPPEYQKNINGWLNIVHPDYRQSMKEYLQEHVFGNHERFDKTYPIIDQKTGQEKWVHGYGKLKFDENKNPVEMFGTIQDITKHKQDEERLHFQSSLLEIIEEAIIVTDLDGNIQYWNPYATKLYGWEEKEVIGKSIMEITVPQISLEEAQRVFTQLKNGKGWSGEFMVQRKDKSIFPAKVVDTPIYNKQGEVQGIIGLSSDISERKAFETKIRQSNEEYHATNEELTQSLERIQQINKELEIAREKAVESDRLKTVFLANLSHEIRTPMNGILGFANLLKENNLHPSKQKKYLEVIEQSGTRMLSLINDLVDISKIEAGQVQLSTDKVNLNQLMDSLYQFFRQEANHKNLKLSYLNGLPPPKCHVITDKVKLEQVLSNLIKNAIKFTREGKINFGYEQQINSLRFWVKDTGPGISPKYHESVFDRFKQAEDTPLREEEGSGLGLAISKGFIQLMKGDIWVESETGKGATFYFTIPYEMNEPKEKTQQAEKAPQLNGNFTVLIAEDDQTSYEYLNILLSRDNIQTIHASNGQEALEKLEQHPEIKMILMDLKMPVMNGLEATKKIREMNKDIPIIAQSAYASQEDKHLALDTGCNDYVLKPIDLQSIKTIIQKHLKPIV